jgi:hypothetical protein
VNCEIAVATAALSLLLLCAGAAAARACDTPMPENVKIDAPSSVLSADQASLPGVWKLKRCL